MTKTRKHNLFLHFKWYSVV